MRTKNHIKHVLSECFVVQTDLDACIFLYHTSFPNHVLKWAQCFGLPAAHTWLDAGALFFLHKVSNNKHCTTSALKFKTQCVHIHCVLLGMPAGNHCLKCGVHRDREVFRRHTFKLGALF